MVAMHHPCRASASLKARLRNTSLTYFHVKQVAKSWRVSHDVTSTHQFWGATDKPSPTWVWGTNQETIAVILRPKSPNCSYQFWDTNQETLHHLGFEAQLRNRPSVLRTKREKPSQWFWGQTTDKPSTLVLRLNEKICAPRLHVYGAERT
jgi:hypothetical protein